MSHDAKRGLTLEERQPNYEDPTAQPKTLTRSRHIDDVLYVAGRPPRGGKEESVECDIMLITSSVEEDEATSTATSQYG